MLFALLLSQHRLSQNYYYEKLLSAANDAAENIALVNGEIALETQTDTGVRDVYKRQAGHRARAAGRAGGDDLRHFDHRQGVSHAGKRI